ncbi:MAG: four helix bundle protein [Akkermansia sp.]|nr:four helix bundle protein [Akkermansia sp.]MBR6576515.1 four helix bundle protein [Akkermansia sp.]
MNEHNLMDESMEFAIAIILSLDEVEGRGVLKNQLLRSATSIGANIREAQYASSRADFVLKLKIALKESNESEYWLELMERTHILASEKAETLLKACRHIRYMLVRSVNTAKANGRSN